MTIEDEFVDVIDIPKSRPYNPELRERCVKMNKQVSKSDISCDYEGRILCVLQEYGPCNANQFYKKIDITEGQLYYRIKKLLEQGLILHKNKTYFLVQKENPEQKEQKEQKGMREPLRAILGLIMNTGPLRCVDIYRSLDMNESTCYYRLEKLCNEGILVKRDDLLYALPDDQEIVQEEKKPQPKISPGPNITCKNHAFCKYFDSNTCYPEICKYFIENKKEEEN